MRKIIRLTALMLAFSSLILTDNAMASSDLENVALGKPTEAYDSAFFGDGGNTYNAYIPANAVDGNTASRWSSSWMDKKSPQILEIDLLGTYEIEHCKLRFAAGVKGFTIQYFENGWSDVPGGVVSDTAASGSRVFDIEFIKPVLAKKVRFYYTDSAQIHMQEFEVYGRKASSDMFSEVKEFSDIDDKQLKKEVQLLNSLRIMQGLDDGNFHPEKNVTRQEFVGAVISALGYADSAGQTKDSMEFNDVKINSEYYGYIKKALELGIISSGEYFRPNDYIRTEEAVSVAVRALGYELAAVKNGGYPTGYMSLAAGMKLTDGGTFAPGKNICRADMAHLIFNMLDCEQLVPTLTSGENDTFERDDKTILESVYDIYCLKGNVSAVGELALSGTNAAGTGKIIIDNNIYLYDSTNRDILGRRVEAYFKESELGDRIIILDTIEEKDSLTVKSDDILPQTDAYTIHYSDGSRKKNAKISKMADVYVDGVSKFNYTDADLKPKDGVVILTDSDLDGQYDVVQIRNYRYIVVRNVNKSNETVYGQYGDSFSYANIDYYLEKDGKTISFEALECDDVLRFEKTDADYYNIIAADEKLEGVVSGMRVDDDVTYVVINDVEYKLSEYYFNTQASGNYGLKLEVHSQGMFYLNCNGEIVAYKNSRTDFQYGFLRRAYVDDIERDKGYFEIIDNNNERVVYESAEEVYTNATGEETKALSYAVATELASKPQLVKYKLNSKGEIKTIYVAKEITGKETNISELPFISRTLTGNGGSQLYLPTGKYLSTGYVYTDDTVFYYVGLKEPGQGLSYGNIDKDEIKCGTLNIPGLRPYKMVLYDFNPESDHRMKAAVIFSNWIITYSENRFKTVDGVLNTNAAIFLSKVTTLDESGDLTYDIKCWQKGEKVTYRVKGTEVIDNASVVLEKGDIFFPETVNGKLSNIWLMYDFSKRAYDSETFTDPAFETGYLNNYNFRNGWYKTIGVIKNYEDNIITLDYGSKGYPYKLPKDTRVYIWQNNDIEKGTVADIHVGEYIVLNCNGSSSADILIIRGE